MTLSRVYGGSNEGLLRFIEGLWRVYQGFYRGSMEGLSMVYQESIEGLSRVHQGPILRAYIEGLSRAYRWSIECISMHVKVSMNDVISRLKRAWKKEKYLYFYKIQYAIA